MNKIVSLFFCILVCFPVNAQQVMQNNDGSFVPPYGIGNRYYSYLGADKGLQINVQVWGQVLNPGMYSVPKSTDVVGLISFAGGPTEDANISKIKLVRGGNSKEVFTIDIGAYTKTGNLSNIPELKAGDTVIVPENAGMKFSKVVQIISQVATVVNVYLLFKLLFNQGVSKG
jgi:NADH:ubiquinone oxidoreductase subunit F (NADH-binding)